MLVKEKDKSAYIDKVKSTGVIKVNVFDPVRVKDLEHIKRYVGKYKFKITKIAVLVLMIAMPLAVFASDINATNLIRLTNSERSKNSISQVKESPVLSEAAQNKANDMINRGYFEHYSPDGRTPWDFMKEVNYHYLWAGENLAMDFKTAEGVTNGWMNSGTHRQNILNDKYQEIGIGVVKGEFAGRDTTMVVQMFGTRQNEIKVNIETFVNNVASLMGL